MNSEKEMLEQMKNDLDKLMDSISDVYVRYSDDILIFCKDIDNLNNTKSILINELN